MGRQSLARALKAQALIRGEFKLRSGATSDIYFDKYRLFSSPQLLREVVTALRPLVPQDVHVIAGLELGAVAPAVLLSQSIDKPLVFVRKKAKDYGTAQVLEGISVQGLNVLIVEDVITSGGQVLDAAAKLRAAGAHVNYCLAILDREQDNGLSNLAGGGIELRALFTMSELV
jgi:orotate phosphoribosyltransferase